MALRTGVDMGLPAAFSYAPRAHPVGIVIGSYFEGYSAGYGDGKTSGFGQGAVRGALQGNELARSEGIGVGFQWGFLKGLGAGNGLNMPDAVAPSVVLISPLAVPAGQPGGFPREYDQAKLVPVVLQVLDLNPGLQYAIVVVRFPGSDDTETEEVVYRRGQFRGRYRALSTQADIANGVQLNIRRDGGWPANINTNLVSRLVFDIDATDKAGNLDG